NVGCSSTAGYKMPNMGWMAWNSSAGNSTANDPAPPSVVYGANSSSAQEPTSTSTDNLQPKYPGTQFANTGIQTPTNPMGLSTRTNVANTPQDPSLAGLGGPSMGGPSMGGPSMGGPSMGGPGIGATNPSAPNPQHGFYGTEYQAGGSGSPRSGGLPNNNFPPAQNPNSYPAVQDFANGAAGRVNNAFTDATGRASNFTNETMSQLNTTATNAISRASNNASNAMNQLAQPGVGPVNNIGTKLGELSAGMRSTAQNVAQGANNVGSRAQTLANALGNSQWPPSGGSQTPWSTNSAPVTQPSATGVNTRGIPGVQTNPYVLPQGAAAMTANAGRVNPAFSPTPNSVTAPRTLPTIPQSNGYAPGSTGIGNGPTTIQPAGFEAQQPANFAPAPAVRGGSFSPVDNSQAAPVGNPYPSTGY
ncbi:MAG: hypothetical protein ACI9HK_002227, partial [Pirellulaceae bacterium]